VRQHPARWPREHWSTGVMNEPCALVAPPLKSSVEQTSYRKTHKLSPPTLPPTWTYPLTPLSLNTHSYLVLKRRMKPHNTSIIFQCVYVFGCGKHSYWEIIKNNYKNNQQDPVCRTKRYKHSLSKRPLPVYKRHTVIECVLSGIFRVAQ